MVVDARGERQVTVFHDPGLDDDPAWLPLDALGGAAFPHADVRWPNGVKRAMNAARDKGVNVMLDAETTDPAILAELVPLASHAVFSDAGLAVHAGTDDVEAGLRRVAARFACAVASLKCATFGGRLGCPTRAELDAFIRGV